MACPFCGDPRTYTDPQPQLRCVRCFNHVPGTAGVPNGRMQDTDAAMTVAGHVYPNATGTYWPYR
jgi:hypothetical protein